MIVPRRRVAANLNTLLLLHGDGANGSTSIVDSSFLGLSPTLAGTTQISTAQVQSGFGQSIWIPDSSSALPFASLPSQYSFGTGNFTVEYFVYPTHANNVDARYFSLSAGTYPNASFREITFRQNASNSFGLFYLVGTSLSISASSNNVARNAWQHHAIVKNGTALTAYVDGVSRVTLSGVTTTFNFSNIIFSPGFESGNGYYDEIRISNSAIYTANFTPPSAPFSS